MKVGNKELDDNNQARGRGAAHYQAVRGGGVRWGDGSWLERRDAHDNENSVTKGPIGVPLKPSLLVSVFLLRSRSCGISSPPARDDAPELGSNLGSSSYRSDMRMPLQAKRSHKAATLVLSDPEAE